MTKFTVTINCDTDAFYEVEKQIELARILREIADALGEHGELMRTNVFDYNGNIVGKVTFKD